MKAFTQIRIARHSRQLEKTARFYMEGLGLQKLSSFHDHAGYNGVMLGIPSESWHLEFTENQSSSTPGVPSKDDLLVFYFPGQEERDAVAARLQKLGYKEVEPENPYWRTDGITFEDPEGWRVVLMGVPAFNLNINYA